MPKKKTKQVRVSGARVLTGDECHENCARKRRCKKRKGLTIAEKKGRESKKHLNKDILNKRKVLPVQKGKENKKLK